MHLDTSRAASGGPAASPPSSDTEAVDGTAVTDGTETTAQHVGQSTLSTALKCVLMAYEIAWLIVWSVVLFQHRFYIYHLYLANSWTVPLWIGEAAVFGSLGGTAYSIHGIYSGRPSRDRGPDKWLWYLVKPVHGALMGAVCGLLSRIVLSVSGSTGIGEHILIGGVGLISGMYEHFALGLIRSFSDKKLGEKL